jgi:hypothetical protein
MAVQRLDWTRHPLGMAGAILTTISGILIVSLFVIGLLGYEGGPYVGVLAYTVLPALFVVGLLLIPAGLWLERRRLARYAATGETEPPLPVFDLNEPSMRRRALWFIGATVVNVLIVGLAGFKSVEVMDSPDFCGKACHKVMDPEYTAYSRSPHSRVRCVECHIGPGASWFVKSKLSGAWQLVSVALDLYPRPIPTPVHNLRPARDTCEQCHWPTKFVGDRLKVYTRHDEDEANSVKKSVLLVRVGGGPTALNRGIHWHVAPGVEIRFQSDPKRDAVGLVEAKLPGGETRTFAPKTPLNGNLVWRTMDCVDCHNRPTHIYRTPEDEVEAAMGSGQLDASLPFLRREAVKALKVEYPSQEVAREKLRAAMKDFYEKNYPAVAKDKARAVEAAGLALGTIYSDNVWPTMKIGWGTYPSFLGHMQANGCFRCHDEEHSTKEGKTISQDCAQCHALLAQDEKSPAILKQLEP